MQNILKNLNKEIIPIGLILILAASRLIPHPPNFTPIIAVAIMSSYFFRNIYLSILTLIISMLIADVFIGFYKNMLFVYTSLIIITFIFFRISKKIKYKNLYIFAFFGSLIFYLISNFGVWALDGLYEKNLNGLIECYILAIPFFGNTFLSTLIFAYPAMYIYKSLPARASAR